MADEKKPEDKKPDAPAAEGKYEGLVKVKKDGVVRHVHPTTLKDHLAEGWVHG